MIKNIKNKSKILLIIIGVLLITNIVMLSFFLLSKQSRGHKNRMDRETMMVIFLKNKIEFTEEQLQQYKVISNLHRGNIKKMFDSLHNSKDKQFKELAATIFNDSVMNTIAGNSSASQKVIELQMFNHLKNIRIICTKEQLPIFDSLFVVILNKIGKPHNDDERKNRQINQ